MLAKGASAKHKGAVKKNTKHQALTYEEINQYVALSLINARDRDRGRRERRSRKGQAEIGESSAQVRAPDEEAAGPSHAKDL
ncbi:hypothetical protein FHG87_016825 [Trinorchestia longiramus]|nr:hypothetical protein FHG87_016825 [Trinorchestia longiramus]